MHAVAVLLLLVQAPVLQKDGLQFKDLNRNGVVDPYEDWRLSPEQRARDLVARMTLEEKAGTMMHGTARAVGGPMAAAGMGGRYDTASRPSTTPRSRGLLATSRVRSIAPSGSTWPCRRRRTSRRSLAGRASPERSARTPTWPAGTCGHMSLGFSTVRTAWTRPASWLWLSTGSVMGQPRTAGTVICTTDGTPPSPATISNTTSAPFLARLPPMPAA